MVNFRLSSETGEIQFHGDPSIARWIERLHASVGKGRFKFRRGLLNEQYVHLFFISLMNVKFNVNMIFLYILQYVICTRILLRLR